MRSSIFLSLLLLLPWASWACPVCFVAGAEASRTAYLQITAALLLLPLVLSAGFFWWYRSATKKPKD